MRSITIYLLTHSDTQRENLEASLSSQRYACRPCRSPTEVLAGVHNGSPSCVLADYGAMKASEMGLFANLQQFQNHAPVIVMARQIDVPTTVSLMEQGVAAVLLHPIADERLLQAIQRVHEQADYLYRWNTLDTQERWVVQYMLSQETTLDMADKLEVSTRTLDRRRKSLLEKMNVQSFPELSLLIGKYGIPAE